MTEAVDLSRLPEPVQKAVVHLLETLLASWPFIPGSETDHARYPQLDSTCSQRNSGSGWSRPGGGLAGCRGRTRNVR